jgi:predicted SnoaL-like aldol condensation-catalyzing enzyme
MKIKFLLSHVLLAFVTIPAAFAQDDPPEELANRAVVEAFYRTAFIERDAQAAREFLASEFIQHHPAINEGVDGMTAWINAQRIQMPEATRAIKRVLTDGAHVIVQAHLTNGADDEGAVTGDIFRLEEGRIVEQWGIVHPITPSPDPSNPNDVFGSNSAPYPVQTSVAQERRNLALATGFYHVALNEKDWERAEQYMGPYYQQHSVYMADGRQAFRELVERIQREFPNNLGLVKQSFADGDMVVLNLEVTRDKGGLAYNVIELMRLENDKVVEHWDIFQRLDGVQPVHANGYW